MSGMYRHFPYACAVRARARGLFRLLGRGESEPELGAAVAGADVDVAAGTQG